MAIKTQIRDGNQLVIEYEGYVGVGALTQASQQALPLIQGLESYRLLVKCQSATMLPMNPRVMKDVSLIFRQETLEEAVFEVNPMDRVVINMLNGMFRLLDRGKFSQKLA